jgi:Shikimate kinase
MRIFLAGVACVGKSTIGAKLAHNLDYQFFDLDLEIEKFFGTSIERLHNRYLTPSFPRSGFPGLDLSSRSHELHRFRHSVTPERTNGQLLEGHKKYD